MFIVAKVDRGMGPLGMSWKKGGRLSFYDSKRKGVPIGGNWSEKEEVTGL
jgi:hypothetical protein